MNAGSWCVAGGRAAATNPELQRELEQMKSAGIGGVEIATLYPLALDDPATGFHNYDFVSDEDLDHLRFAADEARRLGLRVDVTLASGWPYGGPHIPERRRRPEPCGSRGFRWRRARLPWPCPHWRQART